MTHIPAPAASGTQQDRDVDPAALVVDRAPALLTVQDKGRVRGRAHGLPRSGAMDRVALAGVNALAGNPPDAAALEWAGGSGRLVVRRPLRLALGGAVTEATLGGVPVAWGTPVRARPGDVLEIMRLTRGRWAYVAVAGGIMSPLVLGARATYLPAALGGIGGRALRRGDWLPVGLADGPSPDAAAMPALQHAMQAVLAQDTVRILPTALADELPGALAELLRQRYTIHPASDRVGTRLVAADAARLTLPAAHAARRSLPTVAGLIQLPPDGHPIILMPDGPTLGGYPALAAVHSDDLSIVAQRPAAAPLYFVLASADSGSS